MANTQDSPGYAGKGAPFGPYGWYAEAADESRDPSSRVVRLLWVVVVVLGVAAFAVSVSSSTLMSFPVRLSVLAAAVAAVGLLPRQAGHGWIVLALAITGSLDALTTWIVASGPSWALPVIFVLNALQSLAAAGALLGGAGVLRSGSVVEQEYSAYAAFAAYQAYARAVSAAVDAVLRHRAGDRRSAGRGRRDREIVGCAHPLRAAIGGIAG